MSVCRLPSGRFRAQVYDVSSGKNISVSRVTGGPGTFETREVAEQMRRYARVLLRESTARMTAGGCWGLARKGERTCRCCGALAAHLHHIVPRKLSALGNKDWERNGLPLCAACHLGWHHRTLEIPHDLLRDAEFGFACEHMTTDWVDRNYPGTITAIARLAAP